MITLRKLSVHFLLLCSVFCNAQEEKFLSLGDGIHFFTVPGLNSADPEKRMAYGLFVAPPWTDGGSLFINLPEHLFYMPGTKGIARHHDQRENVWEVSEEGKTAFYDVESVLEPGVHLRVKAVAERDRIGFTMTITNNSSVHLKSIGSLLCFQYGGLKGFPAAGTDNLAHTYVIIDGRPVALKEINVTNPDARARMAQVKICRDEHNWWAENMGGMIRQPVDKALIALTASAGDRKLIVSWTPGKSILTNTSIPCIHGDPCIGDLAQGESRTVHGVLLFTRDPLESVLKELSRDTTAIMK